MLSPLALLGWLAMALSMVIYAPQARGLARGQGTHGVSRGTLWLGLLGLTCWTVYSVELGNVPSLVASAVPLGLLTWCCVLVGREEPGALAGCQKARAQLLAPSAVLVGAIVVALDGAVPGLLMLTATVLSVVSGLPQLMVALRSRDLSGVSEASWLLRLACSLTWLGYALGMGIGSIVVTSLAGIPTAVIIVWRVRRSRRAMLMDAVTEERDELTRGLQEAVAAAGALTERRAQPGVAGSPTH